MNLSIRQERKKRNWTLNYVSKNIGVTQATVHDIETGRCKPSYEVLVKLEDLFKLNHRKLFAVADDTPISHEENTTKKEKNQGVKKNE